jgi:hypothetical protein
MRSRHAITVGIFALSTVAGTGLAAHAENTAPDATPASALRGGLEEYRIVTDTVTATVAGPLTKSVSCPSSKQRVAGGGASLSGVVAGASLMGNYPTTTAGRSWTAEAIAVVGTTLTVYAVCAEADD